MVTDAEVKDVPRFKLLVVDEKVTAPDTVKDDSVPTVVIFDDPAQVDSAVFSTLLKPTSDLVTVLHAGAADTDPVPV